MYQLKTTKLGILQRRIDSLEHDEDFDKINAVGCPIFREIEVEEQIGHGTQGVTYSARYERTTLIVKYEPPPSLFADKEEIRQNKLKFKHELEITRLINQIFDSKKSVCFFPTFIAGVCDELSHRQKRGYFTAMEKIVANPINNTTLTFGDGLGANLFSSQQIDFMCCALVHGIDVMNSYGIVHNDLHTSNVFVQERTTSNVVKYNSEITLHNEDETTGDAYTITFGERATKYIPKIGDWGLSPPSADGIDNHGWYDLWMLFYDIIVVHLSRSFFDVFDLNLHSSFVDSSSQKFVVPSKVQSLCECLATPRYLAVIRYLFIDPLTIVFPDVLHDTYVWKSSEHNKKIFGAIPTAVARLIEYTYILITALPNIHFTQIPPLVKKHLHRGNINAKGVMKHLFRDTPLSFTSSIYAHPTETILAPRPPLQRPSSSSLPAPRSSRYTAEWKEKDQHNPTFYNLTNTFERVVYP